MKPNKPPLPLFPLFIVSKGRWKQRHTSRFLELQGTPYRIVVEDQEYSKYAQYIDKKKILVLDKQYQKDYDTYDDLGFSKSVGPGPARNFVWDVAMSEGYDWHWVMDDNIAYFYRLNRNLKVQVHSPVFWRVMEEFCLRYDNIAMAGPNYEMFIPRREKVPPFITNTRIYSCNLIRNDVPFRWRGRYNEDTDLSLRMLKAGWCTVQFNALLQKKLTTQTIQGGNTQEFYSKEGTFPKSEMLERMHPDVARVCWRFNRWHHYVDYTPFKYNRLRKRQKPHPDITISKGVNEYGMVLKKTEAPNQHKS